MLLITRLTVEALSLMSHLPTGVDPVKDSFRMALEWHSINPTSSTSSLST